MRLYHATTEKSAEGIMNSKMIRAGWDGLVYMCSTAIDACKFMVIRGITKVVVFELEMKEGEVEESFDHSKKFFGCDAYTYAGNIGEERIISREEYEFEK